MRTIYLTIPRLATRRFLQKIIYLHTHARTSDRSMRVVYVFASLTTTTSKWFGRWSTPCGTTSGGRTNRGHTERRLSHRRRIVFFLSLSASTCGGGHLDVYREKGSSRTFPFPLVDFLLSRILYTSRNNRFSPRPPMIDIP